MLPSLFLKAPQLKTAPTGRFAGLSGEKAEAQVVGIGTRKRRRPTVLVIADAKQGTIPVIIPAVAEARGRVPLGTPAGAFSAKFRRPAPESGKCERKKT